MNECLLFVILSCSRAVVTGSLVTFRVFVCLFCFQKVYHAEVGNFSANTKVVCLTLFSSLSIPRVLTVVLFQ